MLLCFAKPEEAKALAARFPQFDIVATSGGADDMIDLLATAVERGHVRATEGERDRLRAELAMTIETPEGREKVINNCLECHDLDNSPAFDFAESWP